MEIEQASGNYLKASEVKEGDIVVFLDEGTKQVKNWEGKDKVAYDFKVSCNGNEYTYTPTGKSLAMLCSALGTNSKLWVGRKFKCHLVTMELKGKERTMIRPIVIEQSKIEQETV